MGIDSRVIDYIHDNGDNLSFTKAFWKDCEPHQRELDRYAKYVRVLELYLDGLAVNSISPLADASVGSVAAWTSFKQGPKLGHYLGIFLELGPPREGWRWLSVNNTSGHAVPLGPIVQVPLEAKSWEAIDDVISKLGTMHEIRKPFTKEYMFGFLLGIMIGDAGKKRQRDWHRHLELVLSLRYDANERIGDFTRQCAEAIGLRMHRMPNVERYGNKPNGFYLWESQSSALVDWIYNVCLGLRDDELTTYNSVRMEWALSGPDDFRRGLVQGMAESDGSVSISGQQVEFWIGPSWDFVKALLKTFGIESFRSREALTISRSQVAKALTIPVFAPHLQTVRCQKFFRLATAKHIEHGKRLPNEIRSSIGELSSAGLSIPKISEQILERFGVILTYEAVQRWSDVKRRAAGNSSVRADQDSENNC